MHLAIKRNDPATIQKAMDSETVDLTYFILTENIPLNSIPLLYTIQYQYDEITLLFIKYLSRHKIFPFLIQACSISSTNENYINKVFTTLNIFEVITQEEILELMCECLYQKNFYIFTFLAKSLTLDISTPVNSEKDTLLHIACREDLNEFVDFLLKNGADIEKANYEGYSSLFEAARVSPHACLTILSSGVPIDPSKHLDIKKNTPLHVAAFNYNMPLYKYLVHSGFSTQDMNLEKDTPESFIAAHEEKQKRKVIPSKQEIRHEKALEKQRQEIEKSELFAMCTEMEISYETIQILWKKGYRVLENEYSTLTKESMKKMKINKKDLEVLEEKFVSWDEEIERQQQEEEKAAQAAENERARKKTFEIFRVCLVLVAIVYVLVAIGMKAKWFQKPGRRDEL